MRDVPRFTVPEDAVEHSGRAEQSDVPAVQGCERTPADFCLLREKHSRGLAISCRPREEVLELVQGNPAISQLHWLPWQNDVLVVRLGGQWRKFLWGPHEGLVPCAGSNDLAILESIPFGPGESHSHYSDLFVLHAVGFGEAVDADVAELICQYLAAIADVVPGNDQDQHSATLEPTIHMIEEQPLHALRFVLTDLKIVWRIQVNQ